MAREKHVFNGKHEVAHVWARQSQDNGREGDARGGRIFFDGPTIYSYGRHFPIATFHQKKGGEKIVLFTTDSHSVTTSAHIAAARGAVSHYRKIYCLDPVEASQGRHDQNMRNFEYRANVPALKLARATKPERYLNEIAIIRREMEEYADYFKLGKVYFKDEDGKRKKFVYVKILDQDWARKVTAEEIKERDQARAEMKARQLKDAAERRERQAHTLEKWIEMFRVGDVRTINVPSEFTYLRFRDGRIETSKGKEFTREQAKDHYDALAQARRALQARGRPEMVSEQIKEHDFGGWTLGEITEDWFSVGCHKITFKELDRLAELAGLIPPQYDYTMKQEG